MSTNLISANKYQPPWNSKSQRNNPNQNLKKTITLKDLEIIKEITLYVGYDYDDLLQKIVNQKYIINILPKYFKIIFFELPRTYCVTFIWNFHLMNQGFTNELIKPGTSPPTTRNQSIPFG